MFHHRTVFAVVGFCFLILVSCHGSAIAAYAITPPNPNNDPTVAGDGTTVTVTGSGNAQTVGRGNRDGYDNWNVEVSAGAVLDTGNATAISLRDDGTIDIYGTVTSSSTSQIGGNFNTGPNVIEVDNNATITIYSGATVTQNGTASDAEAINLHGAGNHVIVQTGASIITSGNAAAIWFQGWNTTSTQRNVIDNYGTIQRTGGGNVIGSYGSQGIVFTNGGTVVGDLIFNNGDDELHFLANSSVTGSIDGSGGNNSLFLEGDGGLLTGAVRNFQTLTKEGAGEWVMSGSLSGFTAVTVRDAGSVLALTGNNGNFNGTVLVEDGATLRARAQSLPTLAGSANNVTLNQGGTLQLDQDDTGTYTGQIVGQGRVVKTGTGTTILNPDRGANTYSGGTEIQEGTLGIASDAALGATSGALSLGTATTNGTLQARNNLTLAASRAVTINAGGGTVDTMANDVTINQAITGGGALTKTGSGTLTLGSTASTYTGVNINQGTLAVAGAGSLGTAAGPLNFGTASTSGTLLLNNDTTLGAAKTVTLNAGGGTVNTNGHTGDIAGVISGSGALTKTGDGTLTLSNTANTYTGGTNIVRGTLAAGNGSLGSGPLSMGSTNGGDPAATLRMDGIMGINAPVTLNASGGVIDTNGNIGTVLGTVSGPGGLTKTGDGILELLNQNNTYQGGTTINQGTLAVGSDASLGAAGAGVAMRNNTTLDFTQATTSSRPLDIDGNATIQTQGNEVTLNGAISGDGNLIVASAPGGGMLALHGQSNFTGGVTVEDNAGVAITSGASLGASTTDLELGDNSTLRLDADSDLGSRNVDLTGTTANVNTNGFEGRIGGVVAGTSDLDVSGGGVLALHGDNTFDGQVSVGNDTTLAVNSAAALGTSTDALVMANNAVLRLDGDTDLGSRDINLTGADAGIDTQGYTGTVGGTISGASNLNKFGGGMLKFNADQTYSGDTNLYAGTIQVNNARMGSTGATTTVFENARLEGNGTVAGTVVNSGTVAPGQSDGNRYQTLTIDGNYREGDQIPGTLEINTVLGGDNSPTSRLVVTGDVVSTRPTAVTVINRGGPGLLTDAGIQIIEVQGDSPADGFTLDWHYQLPDGTVAVAGGNYLYHMMQGDAYQDASTMKDWYLMNVMRDGLPVLVPSVPLYEIYPQILNTFNQMQTLQQRVGNRAWRDAGGVVSATALGSTAWRRHVDGRGFWTGVEGRLGEHRPAVDTGTTKYRLKFSRIQLGYDFALAGDSGCGLMAGFSAHFAKAWAKVNSEWGTGRIDSDAWGLDASLTYYSPLGFYVDGQARFNWMDSDIKSHNSRNSDQVHGNDAFGMAYSLEAGWEFDMAPRWSLTPQAQLTYACIDFDDFTDVHRVEVEFKRHNSLIGRLGLAANYELDTCGTSRSFVYGLVDARQEFMGRATVEVSGDKFRSRQEKGWAKAALGGTRNWSGDRYSLYGEVGVQSSFRNFGDSYELMGEVGFRLSF